MHIDCSAASRAVSSLRQRCSRAAPRCPQKGSAVAPELHHCFSKAAAEVVLSQTSPAQNCSESWSKAVSQDVPNVCRAALLQGCTDFAKELHTTATDLLQSYLEAGPEVQHLAVQSCCRASANLQSLCSDAVPELLQRRSHGIPYLYKDCPKGPETSLQLVQECSKTPPQLFHSCSRIATEPHRDCFGAPRAHASGSKLHPKFPRCRI